MSSRQQISTRGRALLRRLLCTVCAFILASAPTVADAFVYTDTENQLRLYIPENEHTYFYTPEGTNLFEDLLEQLQNSGQNVRVLVRTYSDTDALGYSLQINSDPLPGTAPPQGNAPEGTIYRDASLMPPGERDAAAQSVRNAYGSRFSFSEPRTSVWNGLPAIEMDGTGVADTAWSQYDCKAYIIATQDHLFTVTLILENSGLYRNAALNMLDAVAVGPEALSEPAPEQETAPERTAETTPEPTVSETRTVPPTQISSPSSSLAAFSAARPLILAAASAAAAVIVILLIVGARKRRKVRLQGSTANSAHNGNLAEAEASAGSAADALPPKESFHETEIAAPEAEIEKETLEDTASVIPEAPSEEKRSEELLVSDESAEDPVPEKSEICEEGTDSDAASVADENGGGHDSIGDTRPFPPVSIGDTKPFEPAISEDVEENDESLPNDATETAVNNVSYATDSNMNNKEDSGEMPSDNSRYIANGHDYTEDVSRYTQQPSADVNDVSRYTHGVGKDVNDELQSLRDMPAETHKSRPSVGSRVERNKNRSRRKK